MALADGIVAHRVMADFMTDDRTEPVLEVLLERFLRPRAASRRHSPIQYLPSRRH